MKKWLVLFTIGIFSLMSLFPLSNVKAFADEKNSSEEATEEKNENNPKDENRRIEELEKKFNVSDSEINKLREQKLGFGEIDTTLELAKQLPGGATDENIQKILNLRQGDGTHKMGWGNVAKELGVKMGDIKGNKNSSDSEESPKRTSSPSIKQNRESSGHSSSNHSFSSSHSHSGGKK